MRMYFPSARPPLVGIGTTDIPLTANLVELLAVLGRVLKEADACRAAYIVVLVAMPVP